MTNLNSVLTPYSTLDDFANFFLICVISILFSICMFAIIHFLTGTISKKFLSLKNIGIIKKIFIYQIIGLIISACFIPVFYYVSYRINANLYLFAMQTIVFMVIGIFLSHWFMVGIVPSYLIANILYLINDLNLNHNEQINSIAYMIVLFIISYLFTLINNIFFKRSSKKSWFFFIIPLSGLLFFIIIRFFGVLILREEINSIWTILIINIVVNWILFLILIVTGSLIQKIINNTSDLQESILYDNKIFVNNGYSKRVFENYVRNNKIKTGLFITFEFEHDGKIYAENRQVLNLLLIEFKNFLETNFIDVKNNQKKYLFFKTKWNQYGMFYEIEEKKINLKIAYKNNYKGTRTKEDFFYQLEEQFKNCCVKPIFYNNNSYFFKTLCFVSIYGVHSNSFDKLVEYNQNLKNNWFENEYLNSVKVFNSFETKQTPNETNLESYKKQYELDKVYLNLSLVKTKDFNSKNVNKFLVPGIIWIEKKIYNFDDMFNEFKEQTIALSIILRNFAIRTLKLAEKSYEKENKKLKNEYLIINYPIFELGQKKCSVNKIMQKIEKIDINKNKLIFNFNFLKIDLSNLEIFFENLKLLRKNSVKISFCHLDSNFYDGTKIYEIFAKEKKIFTPDFIFVSENKVENLKIKKAFKNIPIFQID